MDFKRTCKGQVGPIRSLASPFFVHPAVSRTRLGASSRHECLDVAHIHRTVYSRCYNVRIHSVKSHLDYMRLEVVKPAPWSRTQAVQA